jgi:transposase-like protein
MHETNSEARQPTAAPARKLRTFSAEEKAEWVKKYEQSGLTLPQFSKQAGLEYVSLYRWTRKQSETGSPVEKSIQGAIDFAELKLPASHQRSDWAVELALANGTVLRLTKDAPPTLVDQLLRLC